MIAIFCARRLPLMAEKQFSNEFATLQQLASDALAHARVAALDDCTGTIERKDSMVICDNCFGDGYICDEDNPGNAIAKECPKCKGSGQLEGDYDDADEIE